MWIKVTNQEDTNRSPMFVRASEVYIAAPADESVRAGYPGCEVVLVLKYARAPIYVCEPFDDIALQLGIANA